MKKRFTLLALLFFAFIPGVPAATPPYDLCVYGESASGVTAAIQAARMGKKVVLLSKNDHVGGLVTSGLTATDMNRNDLVGGIAREFYNKLYEYYLQPGAWRNQSREAFMASTRKRTYRGKNDERRMQWVYESSVAEKILLQMLDEAGVEICFGHRLDLGKKARKEGKAIKSIFLDNGKTIEARMFIDASYEGDLLARCGVSYRVGRESNAQYGETFNGIRVNDEQGADLSEISPYIEEGKPASGVLPYVTPRPWGKAGEADERVQAYCYRLTLTNDPANRVPIRKPAGYRPLWYEIQARLLQAHPETKLQQIITLTPMPNKKTDTNHLDFFGASYGYAEAGYKERAEIERLHRDYALGMLWFLGNDRRVPEHIRREMSEWGLPADEFTGTGHFPYQLYVREARRMVGMFVMTEKNVRKNDRTPANHPAGLGSYALDCHYVSRLVDAGGRLRNEGTIFAPTVPYPISYYALVPKEEECTNLLVTVCLSASHVAYSTLRMEPVYMILGQSAATAAVLAMESNLPVQQIPYETLKARLLKDGQLLSVPEGK